MSDLLLSDLRAAWRRLGRRPGFSSLIVLILALGVGVNTAIFSVASTVLVQPLPYPEPEQLVQAFPDTAIDKMIAAEVAESVPAFEASAAYTGRRFTVSVGSGRGAEAWVVKGARVGVDYFRTLRAPLALGRDFAPDESRPGNHRVAILSSGIWQRIYGGKAEAVGGQIDVDGESYTVVGVLSPEHRSLEPGWEVWVPLRIDAADSADYLGSFYLQLVARLKEGASAAQAQEQLQGTLRRLAGEYPNLITDEKLAGAVVVDLHEATTRRSRPILLTLCAGAALVLIIACANVSGLLLLPAADRRRELAIRHALGATGGKLARLLLVEGLLLGALGSVCGLLVGWAGVRALASYLPAEVAQRGEVAINGPVLLFAVAVSLFVPLVVGLVPARRTVKVDLQSRLRDAGTALSLGRRGRQVSHALVIAQVAAATVLLFGSGLLLKNLWHLLQVDPGFRTSSLYTMRLDPPAALYADAKRSVAFCDRVLERTRVLPGVEHAGAIHLLPLTADNWSFPYVAEDHPIAANGSERVTLPAANFRVVSADYFETMSIPLLAGRTFHHADDGKATPVGIVNRTLAEKWWPADKALGKTIRLFGDGGPTFRVVGVVEDVLQHALDSAPEPEMYRPFAQWPISSMALVVRTPLAEDAILPTIRAALREIDPGVPVSEVRPIEQVVRASIADDRYVTTLLNAFSSLSLLLAMVSLYGVISYSVIRRTREVAIRMACGASRRNVLHRILGQGLCLTGLGLGLGYAVSLLFARPFLADRLFQVSTYDSGVLLGIPALICLASLGSCLLPALRATRLDPAKALRVE